MSILTMKRCLSQQTHAHVSDARRCVSSWHKWIYSKKNATPYLMTKENEVPFTNTARVPAVQLAAMIMDSISASTRSIASSNSRSVDAGAARSGPNLPRKSAFTGITVPSFLSSKRNAAEAAS